MGSTTDRLLELASARLAPVAANTRLLDRLQWSRRTEDAFFAAGANALPEPSYDIDPELARNNLRELDALSKELEGGEALSRFLRSVRDSYAAANHMLLAVGTRRFYELSCEQFGGARSMALDADSTNLDLATHIGARLGDTPASAAKGPRLDHAAFIARCERRVAETYPTMKLKIVADDDMSAKVLAGVTRVRVRAGTSFTELEAEGLYAHEIETHVLTGQNGAAQTRLPFLKSGGPRSTRTQEGLAVFAELYGHSLSIHRLRRLVERVKLVAMAEDGASFLDVYRRLLEQGFAAHDAYLDTMRIYRGGVLTGGAPFTKDACYLSGLAEVYNFLRLTLKHDAREMAEVLVSGRLCLDDLDELVELRRLGIIEAPRHLPAWLANWDALVPYFGFTSYLNEIDLPPLAKRFAALRSVLGESS